MKKKTMTLKEKKERGREIQIWLCSPTQTHLSGFSRAKRCSVRHGDGSKRYSADTAPQKTQLQVHVIAARNSQHSLCSSSGNSGLSFRMEIFLKLPDCSQVLTGFPLSNTVR